VQIEKVLDIRDNSTLDLNVLKMGEKKEEKEGRRE
jgi:hypothetical protein